MKKELIEFRKLYEKLPLGYKVSYSYYSICKFISYEAIDTDGSKEEKLKWREFQSENPEQAKFIKLLFIDILILSHNN